MNICAKERIQAIQMTGALKGNTKHKALSSKQIQSTNYQMTKTFRIWAFGFRYCLVFGASDLEFGATI
jgi:hypothetical protein